MSDREILEALRAPFPARAVGWKPQSVKGNRALAAAYIDARDVMQRLDAVVGPASWKDEYTELEGGQVRCRLSLRLGGEWVHKEDVGGESEQPDGGDRRKAAYSDALKRAAVKWSVGRYLYWLPASWSDYDPQKRAVEAPRLPAWALPGGSGMPPEQAEQPTAPADPPSGKTPKPDAALPPEEVREAAAMTVLLARKGQDWPRAFAWLNSQYGTAYEPSRGFRYTSIPEDYRKALCEAVSGMPDKKAG